MTLAAYWWSPRRPLRSATSEIFNHGRAWAQLLMSGAGMTNFGDEISPLILHEITNEKVRWVPLRRADVVCVGSLLNAYGSSKSQALIFGCGVRVPNTPELTKISRQHVLGVRGVESCDALGLPREYAIGDPGLLVGHLFPSTPSARRRRVFVPHFASLGTRTGRTDVENLRSAGYTVVLPNLSPRDVASAISGADFVLASSLHALVFADSFGVPCARLFQPWAREPTLKYADYRSVIGIELPVLGLMEATNDDYVRAIMDNWDGSALAAAVERTVENLLDTGKKLPANL